MNQETKPAAGLPAFVSCKLVHAARITALQVTGESLSLALADHLGQPLPSRPVTQEWLDKRVPAHENVVGGFLVVYPDAYASWSPGPAFEEGCTPFDHWGLQPGQESKYRTDLKGRLVNRETGEAIPDNEPVIVFRGKDRHALWAIKEYANDLLRYNISSAIIARVLGVADRFASFALHFPGRMRDPN